MTSRRTCIDCVRDIHEAAQKAQRFVQGISPDAFLSDDKTAYATIRALTIIGEAAKKIPRSLQARYPEAPWREMAGMRDKLAHDHFGVDLRRVYETVVRDLPPLCAVMERMLAELEQEEREEYYTSTHILSVSNRGSHHKGAKFTRVTPMDRICFCILLTATPQRGILSSCERRVARFTRVWYNMVEGV